MAAGNVAVRYGLVEECPFRAHQGSRHNTEAGCSDSAAGEDTLWPEDEKVLFQPVYRENEGFAAALSDLQIFSKGLVDWLQRGQCLIALGRWPIRHVRFICEKITGEDSARA